MPLPPRKVALVLFSVVALALFHAARWWAVTGLIKAGKGSLATAPGLISPVAIVSIVMAVPLILSLAVVPKAPLILQPMFQGAVPLVIGVVILGNPNARARNRDDSLPAIAARIPIE